MSRRAACGNPMPQKKPMVLKKSSWTVYIVRCANGALYTGITNDLKARLMAHDSGKGAKYTAAFGPVALAWKTRRKDRSDASKLEAAIKKLPRKGKEALIGGKSLRAAQMVKAS